MSCNPMSGMRVSGQLLIGSGMRGMSMSGKLWVGWFDIVVLIMFVFCCNLMSGTLMSGNWVAVR